MFQIQTVPATETEDPLRILASLAVCVLAVGSARADQLIVNGGFENGSLSGWTASSTGDGSFFVASAPVTPLTYNATVGPHSGDFYAVSDDYSGSQTQFLTQSFTAPTGLSSAVLSFSIFVNDVYGTYFGSDGPGGQVSLLDGMGNLLAVLYGPADTFENPVGIPNGYFNYSHDIASLLSGGQMYELQFSNTDTTGLINTGIDDVSLVTTASAATPEPASISLSGIAAALVFFVAYRRSKAVQA